MDDMIDINRKAGAIRDSRLTLRVPQSLKQALQRHAALDRRTVADVVIMTLEARFMPRAKRRGGQ